MHLAGEEEEDETVNLAELRLSLPHACALLHSPKQRGSGLAWLPPGSFT